MTRIEALSTPNGRAFLRILSSVETSLTERFRLGLIGIEDVQDWQERIDEMTATLEGIPKVLKKHIKLADRFMNDYKKRCARNR